MVRLIDANALEQIFCNGLERTQRSVVNSKAKELAEITLCWCLKKLSKAPTVDAVEVVHSKWLRHWNNYICDSCRSYQFFKSNYCPECGAKMDGDLDA